MGSITGHKLTGDWKKCTLGLHYKAGSIGPKIKNLGMLALLVKAGYTGNRK